MKGHCPCCEETSWLEEANCSTDDCVIHECESCGTLLHGQFNVVNKDTIVMALDMYLDGSSYDEVNTLLINSFYRR